MTKRELIQSAAPLMLVLQAQRGLALDFDQAVSWAETLWDRLSARGYGPAKSTGPRDSVDWYGRLPEPQRDAFDRLWIAYGLPKGKQGAAMRWGQIAPDAALTARIVAAAERDRAQPRREGETRKWLQGWLAEQRWTDTEIPAAVPDRAAERAVQVRELLAERQGLAALCASEARPELIDQLAALDARLRALGLAVDATASARQARTERSGETGLRRLADILSTRHPEERPT